MERQKLKFLKASLRMNKKDLIFDWSEVESHRGWKGASILIAVLGLGFFLSVIHVDLNFSELASVKSASVLYLPDYEEGRTWRMKAEEEGPFPGRLEITGEDDVLEGFGSGVFGEGDSWNAYEIKMRPLEMDPAETTERIAAQGQRYLPKIFKAPQVVSDPKNTEVGLKPLLIPYTKESEKWMPTEFPKFHFETKGEIDASGWRFVIHLNAEGRVKECMALNGGDDEGLAEITSWLKGLQFGKAAEEERWLGLRVEFLNERKDGTDPE